MLAEKAQGGTSGFFCKPGLTQSDIADILGSLPSGLASHMPIVAMGGKHASRPDQLVLASESPRRAGDHVVELVTDRVGTRRQNFVQVAQGPVELGELRRYSGFVAGLGVV